jgi:hypothetical protein
MIEVKSKFIYYKYLEINKLKSEICVSLGYNFEFLIENKTKLIY